MMPSLWVHNLWAYSLQIAMITAAGALLAEVLRLRVPALRLAWLQALLLVSVSLPALESRQRPTAATPAAAIAGNSAMPAGRPFPAREAPARPFPFEAAVLWVLAAGVVVRCLWLAAGFLALRRYRRCACPLSFDVATGARVALSDRIDGPITFGLRRPLVLLPSSFAAMSASTRAAILAHELTHVRRRDWLWTVLEELILVPLWFHPALWWLASQIRLCREQVVDAAVTRAAISRAQYIQALVEAAAFRAQAGLLPATLFLRRSHLVKRVASLVKEFPMSKRRSVFSAVAGLAAAVLAVRVAAVCFPLQAEAQNVEPIRIESGSDGLVQYRIGYPRRAVEQGIQGLVVLQLTVDEEGVVSDAFVVSGPMPLRRAALQSVLAWHYDPKRHPAGTSQAAIRFQIPPGAGDREFVLSSSNERERRFAFIERVDASRLEQDTARVKNGQLSGTLRAISLHGLAEMPAVREAIERGRLPVRVGDTVNRDSIARTEEFLHSVDPRLSAWVQALADGGIVLHLSDRVPQ